VSNNAEYIQWKTCNKFNAMITIGAESTGSAAKMPWYARDNRAKYHIAILPRYYFVNSAIKGFLLSIFYSLTPHKELLLLISHSQKFAKGISKEGFWIPSR